MEIKFLDEAKDKEDVVAVPEAKATDPKLMCSPDTIPEAYQKFATRSSGNFCVLALVSTVAMVIACIVESGWLDTCFEERGPHDITLSAYSKPFLHKLVGLLAAECGIFTDQYDDCADYFIGIRSYGHSYFGLSRAVEVTWHEAVASLDPCIDNLLRREAPSNFFGAADGLAVSSMVCAGLALTCFFGALAVGCCAKSCKPKSEAQTPLLLKGEQDATDDFYLLGAAGEPTKF